MSAVELAGVGIQVFGTGLAAEALVDDWREFGRSPLVPAWGRLRAWLARRFGRGTHMQVAVGDSVMTSDGVLAARVTRGLPADASLEELVTWLRERVGQLDEQVDERRAADVELRANVSAQVMAVGKESREGAPSWRGS